MSAQAYAVQDNAGQNYPGVSSGAPRTGSWWYDKVTDALGLTDVKGNYERWLTEQDRLYETMSTNSARAWDEYMDSTKVQRLVDDMKKAGLNPWLALQSGFSANSSAGGSAGAGSSARAVHSSKQKNNNALGQIAMAVIATAKLFAMLG